MRSRGAANYLFLPLFFDSDDVFTHEAGTWLQAVHHVLILEFTGIFSPVAGSEPWFDADEWSVVARIPYTNGRGLELYGYVWFALLVEQGNLLHLALVEDVGIISERLVCYLQDTVVGLYGLACVRVNASTDGSEEAGRSLVVELQGSLQLFTLLASWYLECRVTANLEVDYLVVGVLNMPDNVEFVAGEAI